MISALSAAALAVQGSPDEVAVRAGGVTMMPFLSLLD
jgi:hypothetical protein